MAGTPCLLLQFAVSRLSEYMELFIGDQNVLYHHIRQRPCGISFLPSELGNYPTKCCAVNISGLGKKEKASVRIMAKGRATNPPPMQLSSIIACHRINLGATPDLKTNFSLTN